MSPGSLPINGILSPKKNSKPNIRMKIPPKINNFPIC